MVRKTIRTVRSLFDRSSPKAVLKISFVVSLLCHVGIVLAIQEVFPIPWAFPPVQSYSVEFIRPPVDPSAAEGAAGADLEKIKPFPVKPSDITEDTISLDTSDKRYVSYAGLIKSALLNHWEYPVKARENLIEGKLLILFTLNRAGHLQDVRIMKSSGYAILDNEALKAVRSSAPFAPFPPSVTVARLHVKARFAYRLTSQSR